LQPGFPYKEDSPLTCYIGNDIGGGMPGEVRKMKPTVKKFKPGLK
jgi:hypothetical protein